MAGRRNSRARLAVLAVTAAALAGCTSSVSHYSLPPAPTRSAQHPAQPSSGPSKSRSAGITARCAARKTAGGTPVAFRGTETPRQYCGVVWRSVRSRNCSRLAYGAAVIRFVRRHPCVAVRRVLATVYVGHFSVELSSVTARFGGAEPSADSAALEFSRLAASRRSGGIADLVRAGQAIPGARGRPPANAYYDVTYLVDHIDAIYAWYGTRPASTHGWKSLAQLEHDFSFSRLVS